jgi:polyisoprenoid-binding protein YceI
VGSLYLSLIKGTGKKNPTPMKRIFLLSILVLLASFSVVGQAAYSLKEKKVTVSGSSTLHDWTSDVQACTFKGTFLVANNQLERIDAAEFSLKVTDIKSTKGKIMDNKTYEAFDFEKNPNITYKLTTATLTGQNIKASGQLTMAGASRAIDLLAAAKVLPNGDMKITGSYKINMKDYKMTPPTAMMGTIKVGEEVTVNFDLTLTPIK